MHFGEYELSPSLIGLSPLPTSHPKTFQRQLVRSSNKYYLIFNLLMARSLGFGFNPKYCRPIKTRFRYAYTLRLKLALQTNSLTHYTKGTRSPLRASTICYYSFTLPMGRSHGFASTATN